MKFKRWYIPLTRLIEVHSNKLNWGTLKLRRNHNSPHHVVSLFFLGLTMSACGSAENTEPVEAQPQSRVVESLEVDLPAGKELSIEEFNAAVAKLGVDAPTKLDPLAMNAVLVPQDVSPGDTVIAAIKLKMMPTWYIYSVVPKSQPFIETDWILETGSELAFVDDWAGPPSRRHKQLKGVKIHEARSKELIFFREMRVQNSPDGEASVEVGLNYQICNPELCLQPKKKTKTLKFRIKS